MNQSWMKMLKTISPRSQFLGQRPTTMVTFKLLLRPVKSHGKKKFTFPPRSSNLNQRLPSRNRPRSLKQQ
ncbi:unnamed protein product [Rhodiola kirilowii]